MGFGRTQVLPRGGRWSTGAGSGRAGTGAGRPAHRKRGGRIRSEPPVYEPGARAGGLSPGGSARVKPEGTAMGDGWGLLIGLAVYAAGVRVWWPRLAAADAATRARRRPEGPDADRPAGPPTEPDPGPKPNRPPTEPADPTGPTERRAGRAASGGSNRTGRPAGPNRTGGRS